MKQVVLTAMAVAGLSLSVPTSAAPDGPDPARLAAAEKLMDAMHYDSQIDRTLEAVIVEVENQVGASLSANLSDPAPELVAKIKDITGSQMRDTFRVHHDELKRGTALIYAKHFTAAELERLAKLQSDPVLVKMQTEMPQIATESMALSQAMATSGSATLQARIKAAVEEYYRSKGEKPGT
jgi:hypothetical protein